MLGLGSITSCLIDNTTDLDDNGKGLNVATFLKSNINLTVLANGDEYVREIEVKLVGPSLGDIKNDISVTVQSLSSSTAEDGVHYRIDNPTIILSPNNNFLGKIKVTLMTAGNTPPMDGTPEFESYVAPLLDLKLLATGDPMVTGSGKMATVALNFTPPNPYAGDYTVELKYFHPTAGGSYPDDPYGGIRSLEKTLIAVTGRKCETGFGVWGSTDICWITINADNSIDFVVDLTWNYTVKMGDPKDPTHVSYFDPATGKIYLYYYYSGTGGDRIFWEVFTPVE